jgi:hypothetical protein
LAGRKASRKAGRQERGHAGRRAGRTRGGQECSCSRQTDKRGTKDRYIHTHTVHTNVNKNEQTNTDIQRHTHTNTNKQTNRQPDGAKVQEGRQTNKLVY